MKTILITLLLLASCTLAMARQDVSPFDTLAYKMPGKMDILILSKDYHLLTRDTLLRELAEKFQESLQQIKGKIPEGTSYTILYQLREEIKILPKQDFRFFLDNDNRLVEGFKNQAILTSPNSYFKMVLDFTDVEEVMQANFHEILYGMTGALPPKDRYLRHLSFQSTGDGKFHLTENRPSGYLDMLSLQLGVGANVYQNKFLTDFTGEIGLQLNQKGILKNQFYLSNNLIFSFDGESGAVVNSFTNIGYRRNLSNQRDKPNWLGVEFGTMSRQRGNVFAPNTMRLGVNWSAGKHITVSPQLYFNGMFQQVSPGFRIGIGL